MKLRTTAAALLIASCAPVDSTFDEPDVDFNRMIHQPKYEAYALSPFFPDRSVMRHPPRGTVQFVGRGNLPGTRRSPPTQEALEEGRRHYEYACAACHGIAGFGDTYVASRMQLRPPPSLHATKARSFTNAQLHDIVRNGYGLMPGYGYMLAQEASWAVVYYLRALQLSQRVQIDRLPADMRRELEGVQP